MALRDIRGFMANPPSPKKKPSDEEELHLKVDSWQWETKPSRFTWKHGLVCAILLAVAILLTFGFLIIGGVVLLIALILHLIFWLFKKLS